MISKGPSDAEKTVYNRILLLAFVVLVSIFYRGEAAAVPFHPDESTQLYMSSDFETLFRDPASLFWQPAKEGDLRQHYREIDAPLTRYLLGAGRWLTGQPALQADWDWSRTWQQNQAAGALPDENLLLAGRLAVTALFPLTLLLVYAAGSEIGGAWAGWITLLLTASNALVLLHTRRAMAEGPLLFCSALALFWMLRARRWLWLAALPVALAFNAKQTAVALLVPAFIALLWPASREDLPIQRKLAQLALFAALFAGVTFALNPFLWHYPMQAEAAALRERSELTARQTAELSSIGSPLVGTTFADRLSIDLFQTWINLPAVADVGNYLTDTQSSEDAYFANPLHNLLRGVVGGVLLMVLSLIGFGMGASRVLRDLDHPRRRALALLLAATLAQAAVCVLLPVAFQRYFLVLVLHASLWIAYLTSQIVSLLGRRPPTAA